MATEAILIEHAVGDGWLEVIIGGRRSTLSEATSRLRGEIVDAALALLPRNTPGRVVFLVVDESVDRGEYDLFVRLLQDGQRPPLSRGFDCICDDRLVEYGGGR